MSFLTEFTAQQRIDRVEKFVQDFHGDKIVVKPDPTSKYQVELASLLAASVEKYEMAKQNRENAKIFEHEKISQTEVEVYHASLNCARNIDAVKAQGMMLDIGELQQKLKKCESERVQLEQQLNETRKALQESQDQTANLERLLSQGSGRFFSDVERGDGDRKE